MSRLAVLAAASLLLWPLLAAAPDSETRCTAAGTSLSASRPALSTLAGRRLLDAAEEPPRPRIHIYDLPDDFMKPCYHWGCDRLQPLLRASKYYEPDHTKADLFLVPHQMPFKTTNWAPAAWAYIRDKWPYLNRSIASGQVRHYITLTCDHGPGDCEYVPRPIQRDAQPWWWSPVHPRRVVGHVQLNGLRDGSDAGQDRCIVCFQHGKDVQLVTPEMVCGPLCGYNSSELKRWAAHSAEGPKPHAPSSRPNLLFYGGRVLLPRGMTDPSGRFQLYSAHKNRPGFRLINTAGDDPLHPIDTMDRSSFRNYAEEAASAEFCFSPLGQFEGDTDRYVPAVLMGCIPVMLREVLNGVPMSQPLDERLNWHAFAVLVSMDELARLHEILEAISPARRARMRRVLAKLWPRFLWTSVYGPYLGEDGKEDAFETTMQVLRRRVALMPPLPRTAFGE